MFWRTFFVLRRAARRSPLGLHDVGRLPLRVMPTDLDVANHVNNGVFFSLMDLGRYDLMTRAGAWQRLRAQGMYPVVIAESLAFRKSLLPWQRYELETRIIGYDEKSVWIEQRFVVKGEIYARGYVRGRFLRRRGGVVPIDEVAALVEADASAMPVPEALRRWGEEIALPSTRQPAPSEW